MNPSALQIDVPEWLRPAVVRATEQLPESVVREIGRSLPGGFTKRPAILAAWKRTALDFQQITPEHAGWLRDSGSVCGLLAVLDPFAIAIWIPILAGITGPEALALALWLDLRESVSALAQSDLLGILRVNPIDPAVARKLWHEQIQREFLGPFGIGSAAVPATPALAVPASPSVATSEGTDLERHQRWLKHAQKALADEKAARTRESAELRETHQASVAELTAALDTALGELAALRADTGARIRTEVAAALDAQVRPWLARAVELETQADAAAPECARLTREVGSACERQERTDRQAGNRARLRDELRQLLELREAARKSAGDALQPLGEWPALCRRLDAAIDRHRRLLGDLPDSLPSGAPAWLADLAEDLALSGTPAAVDAVLHRVRSLADAGLLQSDATAWFEGRAAIRRSVLTDPLRRSLPVAPVRIGDMLRGLSAGVILIDAYNWIGRAGEELGVSVEPARFPESLRQLHAVLRRLAVCASRTQIVLVADGPQTHHRDLAPNLRIVWSGGEGRHRADGVLLGELRHLRSNPAPPPVFVVTDDRDVRRQAYALGAEPEECLAFARRVNAVVGTERT